jgi:hypothetical protein
MTVKELFAKIFGLAAMIAWTATFAAAVWQIWFTFSTGRWEWLTVFSVGSVFPPNFQASSFYATVIYSLFTLVPLILFLGILATFMSFLAEKLD